jgi:hypothetical protein
VSRSADFPYTARQQRWWFATHGESATDESEYGLGTFLHASSADFDEFKVGASGVVFLSEAQGDRKTQAEHISEGPFGGYLYAVKLKKGKLLDPYADPEAHALIESLRTSAGLGRWPHYVDAYDIIKAAKAKGYNRFRFYEDSVKSLSDAVTDPKMIKIIGKKKTK